MKVLVVKRDKLGDLLLTTPLLAQLKASRPQAEVHLLANDYNAWVVEGNPHLDRLWMYRRVRDAGRVRVGAACENLLQFWQLRRERYDWVLVANGEESPRAIRRALAAGGRRCVAYCRDPAAHAGVTDALAVQPAMHEMDRLLGLLAPLGIPPPAQTRLPEYVLPGVAARFAASWLAERGLAAGGYVVLGLGARRAKKQPSTPQVLRWSEQFRARWGLATVFMWTPGRSDDPRYPGDDEIAQPVLDALAPDIHPHRGPIREALGLIWSARASLFPDSGLMHFAAASPGGVLGFFAETGVSPSPVHWGPRGRKADYLEAGKSVSEIPDALVYERLGRLLSL
jgi:ADP-heptose:LPS heptosyltransferase